ncbi:DMT family transporter [Desulfococcus sp.]|uniref:DMT family transporter n=1 Tax=Desulfococcus sp. TaxID=2025834 RepID=UPI003593EC00
MKPRKTEMSLGAARQPSTTRGYLAVLAAAACWGTSGIFIKLIMSSIDMPAVSLAFWRDAAAFLLFMGICGIFRRRELRIQKSDWPWLGLMGISLGLFHVSWNLGIFLNGPAVTTVQQAAMPVIVIVVARIAWGEPLTVRKIGAILLIITGTIFVSGMMSSVPSKVTAAGVAAGFCVPATYAAWSILGKKVSGRYAPEVVLTHAFGVAVLVLLPLQFSLASPLPVPPRVWLWFAGLITLSTVGGFFAFAFGLKYLPAGVSSILAMSEILFVSMYAYCLWGEMMTAIESIGALLVICGVIMLLQRRRLKPAESCPAAE